MSRSTKKAAPPPVSPARPGSVPAVRRSGIIVIDSGTSGIKSALIVDRGAGQKFETLGASKKSYDILDGATLERRVWNPELTVRMMCREIFHQAIHARRNRIDIRGIAVTATTSSVVAVEGANILEVPPPMRWDDLSSTTEADQINELREKCGAIPWLRAVTPDMGLPKALYIARNYPAVMGRPRVQLMEQASFLNWILTGRFVHCDSILARKWGRNDRRPWPGAFFSGLRQLFLAGLPQEGAEQGQRMLRACLPDAPIIKAGGEIGKVRPEVAKLLLLPNDVGVYSVPYDTVAQFMGLGMVAPENSVGVSFGTSLGICAFVSGVTKKAGPAILPIIPDVPAPGSGMIFEGVASCGNAIDYICKSHGFLKDHDPRQPNYERIEEELPKTVPGANGVVMLPFVNGGIRSSTAGRSGGRMNGLTIHAADIDYIRALFEALAYLTRFIVEKIESQQGLSFSQLRVSGGPTKGKAFLDILANVTGRRIIRSSNPDTAPLGAACCAAVGLRWRPDLQSAAADLTENAPPIHPDPELTARYEKLYKAYLKEFRDDLTR